MLFSAPSCHVHHGGWRWKFEDLGIGLREVSKMTHRELRLGRAWPTRLQLAVGALVDVPMRPRVAHVAVPEYEGRVGLDDLEGVRAA